MRRFWAAFLVVDLDHRERGSVSFHHRRHTAGWRTFYTRKRDVKLASGEDFSSPEANESKSSISFTGRIAIEAGGVHEVELRRQGFVRHLHTA